MAGLGRKVFSPGEVLTATNVQNYLMDQAVQVYADSAARGSAIGSATTEGMISWLSDLDELQVATGTATWVDVYPPVVTRSLLPAGSILQVVQDTKLDSFSTSSASYADVTGLAVTITPTSSSNQVLILCQFQSATINQESFFRLAGGNSATYIGATAGSRERAATQFGQTAAGARPSNNSLIFLDAPATTSATTYKLQVKTSSDGVAYVGRGATDGDSASIGRFPASIIAMEVKA
jgi:hypothetical protein